MADIHFSDLATIGAILGNEIIPIENATNTMKTTANDLKEYAIGDTNISTIGDGTVTGAISETTNSIEAMVNVYGAKNLLSSDGITEVKNGVTFTVNSDGSITANGTATADVNYVISKIAKVNASVKAGTELIVTGTPSNSNCSIYVGESAVDRGEGATMTTPLIGNNIVIHIENGKTVSNVTLYPMIRDARIADSTYVPYAMTNRELTNNLPVMENVMDEVTINANSINSSLSLKSGKQFSDYSFINLIAYDSNYVRGSIFTGKNPEDSGKFSGIGIITAGGVMTPFSFKQLSQTTLQIDNNASSSYKFMMRGIRRFDKS